MYIYHYPVFQLLFLSGLVNAGAIIFVPLGFVLTLPLAAISWLLVERPALRRRNVDAPERIRAIFERHARGGVPPEGSAQDVDTADATVAVAERSP